MNRTALSTLALGLVLAAAARAQEAPGTDIVCLFDVSRSVARADRAGDRFATVRALLEFVLTPGDRVAMARYAGPFETATMGPIALPWRGVPADGDGRRGLRGEIETALAGIAATAGRATDWQAATAGALAPLLADRGDATARPLWIVLVTDGQLDPIEGGQVPEAYLPADAPAEGLRDAIVAQAAARFRDHAEGLALLGGERTHVTAVRVGSAPTPDLLATVAAKSGIAPLALAELGPAGVVRAALAALPRTTHGVAALTCYHLARVPLPDDAAVEVDLPVVSGLAAVRVLGEGVGGPAMLAFPPVADGGRAPGAGGGTGPVVAATLLPEPGRVRLLVQRPAGSGATEARLAVYGPLAYDVRLRVGGRDPIADPGRVVTIHVALHPAGGPDPLPGVPPFEDFTARLRLRGPDGKPLGEITTALYGAAILSADAAIAVPEDCQGACQIEADVTGFRGGVVEGQPAFVAAPAKLALAVRAPLDVTFAASTALVGQPVPVVGTPVGERPAGDTVTVGIAVGAGEALPVPLTWEARAGRFEGVFIPEGAGHAAPVAGPAGTALVRAAAGATCDVRARTVTLVGAGDAPPPEGGGVVLGAVEGGLGARVRVKADLVPGETGRARMTAMTAAGVVALDVVPVGGTAAKDRTFTVGVESREVDVRVPADTDLTDARVTVEVELPGGSARATLALRVPPPAGRWRILLVLIGGLLVGAAGFLVVRHTTPEFETRQLRFKTPGRDAEYQRFLREFPRAGMGRVAEGTPEAPRAVGFRLKGLRGITPIACLIYGLKPYVRIQVNGEDIPGPRALADGDQIVVKGATLTLRYTYYDADRPGEVIPARGATKQIVARSAGTDTVNEALGEELAPNEIIVVDPSQVEATWTGEGSDTGPKPKPKLAGTSGGLPDFMG